VDRKNWLEAEIFRRSEWAEPLGDHLGARRTVDMRYQAPVVELNVRRVEELSRIEDFVQVGPHPSWNLNRPMRSTSGCPARVSWAEGTTSSAKKRWQCVNQGAGGV
jgi:hypothetical protein